MHLYERSCCRWAIVNDVKVMSTVLLYGCQCTITTALFSFSLLIQPTCSLSQTLQTHCAFQLRRRGTAAVLEGELKWENWIRATFRCTDSSGCELCAALSLSATAGSLLGSTISAVNVHFSPSIPSSNQLTSTQPRREQQHSDISALLLHTAEGKYDEQCEQHGTDESIVRPAVRQPQRGTTRTFVHGRLRHLAHRWCALFHTSDALCMLITHYQQPRSLS